MAVDLEHELVGALLAHVGDISQVEDAGRSGLVLSTLGEEQQALAGLAGPGSDGVGNGGLLVLEERGELLGLDSLLAEVEVAFGEAKTPEGEKVRYCLPRATTIEISLT